MQLNHAPAAVSAVFDDPNLVSVAGLVPVMRLAEQVGLGQLADRHLTVPTDKGANAGAKTAALVAGMIAGADSIDDMNVLRHGGMRSLFRGVYAPSTLGSFLRAFTFGHVRQLDAVAARVFHALAVRAPIIPAPASSGLVFVDIDDTVIEVHSAAKQGAGIGYSRVRGLNAAIVTGSTASTAPVILAQRLRRGQVNSPRGADRLLSDALTSLRRTGTTSPVLVRADSAYYGYPAVSRVINAGADISVTVKRNPAVTAAIDQIPEDDWQPITYPNAIRDERTGELISDAEVAEISFTAFTKKPKKDQIPGRLVVRRVKAHHDRPGHPALFDTFRYHAFFTTVPRDRLDTIVADRVHRAHAIIEQVHADLKNGPLAHLPSGRFPANSAWLVLAVIAFNLTRAAAVIADTSGRLARATTATIRRTLVTVPARLARSARRITLHLPHTWPWETAFARLFTATHDPPSPASL